MKNLVLFLLAALPMAADPITSTERDALIRSLKSTTEKFHKAVAGLSEAQYNFKASPEKWSIAECAEHIAVSEDALRSLVSDRVMKIPATPGKIEERKQKDAAVIHGIIDRSQKFKAPESLTPTRRFATLDAAVAHFNTSRKTTTEYAASTQDDLRAHSAPHPALKELDGYQWLLLLSGHTERHTLQILEVKAESGFPQP
ncbi:MAG: DinB family protein [Acidobacteriia bacterium]|nr:DinB family protein [Terriglobia bacterium]